MIGIYSIINKINNKVYIGESTNISMRWKSHKKELIEGTHHSYKLQQDWNKYGIDKFIFKVIEVFHFPNNTILDKRKLKICLLCREFYHMQKNNSILEGYNVENTLQNLYFSKHQNKELQEYLQKELKQIVDDNINLSDSPYNIETIISICKTNEIDNQETIVYKPTKLKPNSDDLSIARINKYIQNQFGVKFTKYQLADLLIDWGYLVMTNSQPKRYKPTDKGLESGDIIQYGKVYLTAQGLEKVVEYIKLIYDLQE